MSKTFCIIPFTRTMITNTGNIKLCCINHNNTGHTFNNSTITNWWNGEQISNVRRQLLNNEEPLGCQVCFDTERAGGRSYRNRLNVEYKIIEKYAEKTINYLGYPGTSPSEVEISIHNLCNLKCLMCNEYLSSSIFSENKILKINVRTANDEDIREENVDMLRECFKLKLKKIVLVGGEPLMIPAFKEVLRWAIEQDLVSETTIAFSTNGTLITDEWLYILSKIPNLNIAVSIDSYGQVNEYVRYGSNWKVIEENVSNLSKLPNVKFVVHATVQNLTILSVHKLIEWCKANNYHFSYQVLEFPKIFAINNMPGELRLIAKDKLDAVDHPRAKELSKLVSTTESDLTLWDQFMGEINMRDAHRKNLIFDAIPEFRNYWNATTTE